MPRFRPSEDTWPLYERMGSWGVAMVLILFEGFSRHFIDYGMMPVVALLLGYPVVSGYERSRRRGRDGDA